METKQSFCRVNLRKLLQWDKCRVSQYSCFWVMYYFLSSNKTVTIPKKGCSPYSHFDYFFKKGWALADGASDIGSLTDIYIQIAPICYRCRSEAIRHLYVQFLPIYENFKYQLRSSFFFFYLKKPENDFCPWWVLSIEMHFSKFLCKVVLVCMQKWMMLNLWYLDVGECTCFLCAYGVHVEGIKLKHRA